ncbi:MAG: IS21 family transposase, partial [Cyanobacteria bacterium J06607_15]
MPKAIHLYQKKAYMNARDLGLTQRESSSIAEISERTGQRIDAGNHRSNRGTVKENTTSRDPLAEVWSSEL